MADETRGCGEHCITRNVVIILLTYCYYGSDISDCHGLYVDHGVLGSIYRIRLENLVESGNLKDGEGEGKIKVKMTVRE